MSDLGPEELRKEEIQELVNEERRNFQTVLDECSKMFRETFPEKKKGKAFFREWIEDMYDKQNRLCGICFGPLELCEGEYEFDHKIPFSRGGGNELENIQLVHPFCNRQKGTQVDPYALLPYLKERAKHLMNLSERT